MKNALSAVILLFMICSGYTSLAQKEEIEVMKPIDAVFKGMRVGDSAMVHNAFTSSVLFVTIGQAKDGKPYLRKDDMASWLKAIGTPHKESWKEVIWDTEIRIDGNFAQVWARFGFFLNDQLLHCGVDAFHLFKGADGKWRIFSLADTHQSVGCVVPENVK